MNDEIKYYMNDNGELEKYNEDFDVIIHCENEEEQERAIRLIQRNNALKPDLEGDGYDKDGNIIYDTWICPGCGEHYEIDYDRYDYCPRCGQHIDRNDLLS